MNYYKILTKQAASLKGLNFCRFYGAVEFETAVSSRQDFLNSPFRCAQKDPLKHTISHEGQFYQIPLDSFQKLFTFCGSHPDFKALTKGFNECAVMVRKPAIEIIQHFKNTNFDLPVNRYLLYGNDGCGKTITLTHLVHLISQQPNWVIIHPGWVPKFARNTRPEKAPSTSRAGRFDLTLESVIFLQHFKLQNSEILSSEKLNIENTYIWNVREKTEKGQPLTDLIEQGISRPKYSSDCVAALLKECKLLAKSRQIKVAVIIDGVNALLYDTIYKREDKTFIHASDVTILRAFTKLLKNDWNNGIVITAVDKRAGPLHLRHSIFPRYLMTKEGFELMDPFIPIHVDNYSTKEINSCLDYYNDRYFIQSERAKSEDGREQLRFLSGQNPMSLRKLCEPL